MSGEWDRGNREEHEKDKGKMGRREQGKKESMSEGWDRGNREEKERMRERWDREKKRKG